MQGDPRSADNRAVSAPPLLPLPAAPVERPIIPASAPAAPALSPEHIAALLVARARGRKVGRAVAVARFDGWSIAAFGFLTFLFGIGTPSSMLIGGLMGVIAFVELRAAGELRRLRPDAARTLGLNQIALAGLLVCYAVWRIYLELNGAGDYAEIVAADAQLAEMLKPVESLTRLFTLALNGGIIAFALFAQGGMALYYFSRAKHVRAYIEQTPAWVITVQQAGSYV